MPTLRKIAIWVLKPYPESGARIEIDLVLYKNKDGKIVPFICTHHRWSRGEGKSKSKRIITDEHKICFKGKKRCNKVQCQGCEYVKG
jgi:hypothetical protein